MQASMIVALSHWFLSMDDTTKKLLTTALSIVLVVLGLLSWMIKKLFDKKDASGTRIKSPETTQTGIKNETKINIK